MTEKDILTAFTFVGGGERLYDAIMILLDAEFEEAILRTLQVTNQGETRAHYAGQSESLANMRSMFSDLRTRAVQAGQAFG